ncbi:hypothetical protein WMY93_008584 [Mugilogobius chulae]|uniref:Uncharacterized protein n=1 Tax=Mugilogobius chulae TaxID=88201 RepID=A0AAW0PMW3_9GOBI
MKKQLDKVTDELEKTKDECHRVKDQLRKSTEEGIRTRDDLLKSTQELHTLTHELGETKEECDRDISSSAYFQSSPFSRPTTPEYGQRIEDYINTKKWTKLPNGDGNGHDILRSRPFNNSRLIQLGLDDNNNIRLYC